MFKKNSLLLSLFFPLFLFSSALQFPKYLDFETLESKRSSPKEKEWGYFAFNVCPEIGTFVNYLKYYFPIEVAVETGTYYGDTAFFLSFLFEQVHTIEFSEENHKIASQYLKNHENVHCHFGSSEKILAELLPSLEGKPILFYLDAHWNHFWPLLEELEQISKTHKDNCIIIIDDFKVPGRRDIPYDRYENHECSYEYIQGKLGKIYSSYIYLYLIPRFPQNRAKFVAIPQKWIDAEQAK